MMAEAYHNETLRKQRVIDRALEARKRIEDQKKVVIWTGFKIEYLWDIVILCHY